MGYIRIISIKILSLRIITNDLNAIRFVRIFYAIDT
jgi:hypothetical protein